MKRTMQYIRVDKKLLDAAKKWGLQQKPPYNKQQSLDALVRRSLEAIASKKEIV